MIKNKLILSGLAAALCFSVSANSADSTVVGVVSATSNSVVTLNPISAPQKINQEAAAYILGDVISTKSQKDASANVVLSSGEARFIVAPKSVASIDGVAPLAVNVVEGAVRFEANSTIQITSPKGVYSVSSEGAVSGLAVYKDNELAIVSTGESLIVQSELGDVLTKVESGEAFLSSKLDAPSKVVNVASLGDGQANYEWLWWVLGGAAVVAIISSSDSDSSPAPAPEPAPAPVTPPASPAS